MYSLILTTELDKTTDIVIDWLNYFNIKVIRINKEDCIEKINFSLSGNINSLKIKTKEKYFEVKTDDNYTFWYRKGRFKHGWEENNKNDNELVTNYLSSEWSSFNTFLIKWLSVNSQRYLGEYYFNEINKLEILMYAQQCGFKVPSTLIVDNKDDFYKSKISPKISKPLQNSLHIHSDSGYYITRNVRLSNDLKINSSFYPSLVQQEIDKKIEIKVFFLGQKLYPMAIISKESILVDMKENSSSNLHYLPFRLEKEVSHKLLKLISKTNLKIGTIDLICSKNNEYFFLEINPAGQFGDISSYCNYNLEYEVAKYLKV